MKDVTFKRMWERKFWKSKVFSESSLPYQIPRGLHDDKTNYNFICLLRFKGDDLHTAMWLAKKANKYTSPIYWPLSARIWHYCWISHDYDTWRNVTIEFIIHKSARPVLWHSVIHVRYTNRSGNSNHESRTKSSSSTHHTPTVMDIHWI